MKTLAIGAALSICAAALIGFGALSPGWYEVESSQRMRVGLLGGERCANAHCGRVSLDRFGADSNTRRLGVAVALSGVLAGLGLLVAAGLGLRRRKPGGFVSRVALGLAVFAVCGGLAFHLLTPFSDGMSVGLGAFAFFLGAALCGATAAVPLGALKRSP